jgi:LPS export ABC transporter protein LptC
MPQRREPFIWTCFFFLSLTVFLVFGACEERIKLSVVPDLKTNDLPSHESWNSTITFSDSGRIQAILKVGHLEKYEETQKTYLEGGLHVDFFDENGNHTSVLTALKGSVDDRTHDLEATGNVVVVSDSGTTLQTEQLFWKNATRRVHSDQFVKITSPKEEIQGQGLDSDETLKNYKIYRVTGQTRLKE